MTTTRRLLRTSGLTGLAYVASLAARAAHGAWLLGGRRPDRRPAHLMEAMEQPPPSPRR